MQSNQIVADTDVSSEEDFIPAWGTACFNSAANLFALRSPDWVGSAVPRNKFLEAFFERSPRVIAK
jgi:hypothetical protein